MQKTNDYQERINYDANGNILSYTRNGAASAGAATMDQLTYAYNRDANGQLLNNRLRHVKDAVPDANYSEDIDTQPDDNYSYDAIGNLIADKKENISSIEWNVYGKIKSITKTTSTVIGAVQRIDYSYDPMGNRIMKTVTSISSLTENKISYTAYVRDATGNVMAIYGKEDVVDSKKGKVNTAGTLALLETHLYGSSRLGIWNRNVPVTSTVASGTSMNLLGNSFSSTLIRGSKFFELSNHLGNVLVTVSDKKIPHVTGTLVDYYLADVVTANDYYPFGMGMVGRKYAQASSAYRFGFNGMEDDRDVKGTGTQYETQHRIYDSRLGKWFTIDNLANLGAGLSPYQFSFDNPVAYSDPSGLWPWESRNIQEARKYARKTGGYFKKYKRNGESWATVSTAGTDENNGSPTITAKVFSPKSVINAKFAAVVAGLASHKEILTTIDQLLDGTGVTPALAEYSPFTKYLGSSAVLATMPFTLSADNMSQRERIAKSDKYMNDLLEKGDISALKEWVEDWNTQPRNEQNKIVFRYMSKAEFANRISPDGAFAVAPPLDARGNLSVKWITPDIYLTSQSAKSMLALPNAPEIAIWTYEVEILATKSPTGPGRYTIVKRKYGEDGGGLEAVIAQPFPIHGYFPVIKD
jgi:RHS repeat-associated protein